MSLERDVKSITYLKNHAAELVREVSEKRRNVVITQNGQAKVVVMDARLFDDWKDAMALLKILSLGEADLRSGRVVSHAEAMKRARKALT